MRCSPEIRLAYLNSAHYGDQAEQNAAIRLLSLHEIQSTCLLPAAGDCHSIVTGSDGPKSSLSFWSGELGAVPSVPFSLAIRQLLQHQEGFLLKLSVMPEHTRLKVFKVMDDYRV